MNIIDTGQSAHSGQAQQAQQTAQAAEAQPVKRSRARETTQAEPQAQNSARAQQDEYVAEPPKAVGGALYAINNISRGVISDLNAQLKVGKRTSSGETIDRKIAEIVLPTGRKSLTIYSKSS